MIQLLFIAIGGGAGALLRYWLANATYIMFGSEFPVGTLVVNILGSTLIGLLYIFLYERMDASPELRAGLIVGLLGAFTTFSTFSIETLNLIEAGEQLKAGLNIILSVTLCITGCWLGMQVGRQL